MSRALSFVVALVLLAGAASGFFAAPSHAQSLDYWGRRINWKDPDEPARREQQRLMLDQLLSKIGGMSGRSLSIDFGVPYSEFFHFAKYFGEDWYKFGLEAGAGYQAGVRADVLNLDLQANASTSALVTVTLFNNTIPVIEGLLGAGNYFQIPINGVLNNFHASSADKWLPQVTAGVKLFGISIWNKTYPTAKDAAKATSIENAFNSKANQVASQAEAVKDGFMQALNASQTSAGQGNSTTGSASSPSTKPENKSNLAKDLLNFKRGCKDMFGSAIVIPIIPPLNLEIDFGVFFSTTLVFELGISGMGFNISASTDLASNAPNKPSMLSQMKSDLKSNELMGGLGSVLGGAASNGPLGLLNMLEDGNEILNEIFTKASNVFSGIINSEIKGAVRVLPAMSAGAWVTAAAVLDLYVASASAGVRGTLKVIDAKVGGSLEMSSVADYADLVATGSMNLFSGMLELFASVTVNAVVYSNTWEWSKVLIDFPGIQKDFAFPIARLAYRDQGAPRVFMCIDGSLARSPHPFGPGGVDECNLAVRLVPSDTTSGLQSDINNLIKATGLEPVNLTKPCTIVLNSNAIVATPEAATDSSACAAMVNDTAKRAKFVEQARARYPEKFTSNLFDDSGNAAVLFEAYWNDGRVAAQHVNDGVSKYTPSDWSAIVAAARAKGPAAPENISTNNAYVPDNPVPFKLGNKQLSDVRQIGWENDADLLSYAEPGQFKTGFCRVEPGSGDCAYRVKAFGVAYPDGKSCVPADGLKRQVFAAKYDCANATNDPVKVAACFVRMAFQQDLCVPPARAHYLAWLMDVLDQMSNEDLFNKMKSNTLVNCKFGATKNPTTYCVSNLQDATGPAKSLKDTLYFNNAKWSANMNMNAHPEATGGGEVTGGSQGPSWQTLYDTGKIKCGTSLSVADGSFTSSSNMPGMCNLSLATTGSGAHTLRSWLNATPYNSECASGKVTDCCDYDVGYPAWDIAANSGSMQINWQPGGSGGQGTGSLPFQWTDPDGNAFCSSGAFLTYGSYHCGCQYPAGCYLKFTKAPLKASLGGSLRKILQSGSFSGTNCELSMSGSAAAPDEPFQQKPNTCELMAKLSSSATAAKIDELDLAHKSVVNRYECKDAFAANLTQLCQSAKAKLGMTAAGAFSLSAVFQGDQSEGLGNCTVDASGSTLGLETAPTVTSASNASNAVPDSCEVLVGNQGAGKLAVAKIFSGLTADTSSATCAGLVSTTAQGTLTFCSQIGPAVVRALRAASTPNLSATEVWVRVNSKNQSGATVLGSLLQVGTCNLTEPPSQSGGGICVDPVTKKSGPCATCELLAASTKGYKISIARATNQSTQTDCLAAFQPYSVLCEKLPGLPEIKKENAANPGAFQQGDSVPLSVRFTAPNAVPTITSAATCSYAAPASNNGSTCELAVAIPNVGTINMNGSDQTVGGTVWKTTKLSSTSEPDLTSCKNRFLGSILQRNPDGSYKKNPDGTLSHQLQLDPTCYALSSQIGKGSPPSVPGLKGSKLAALTVTLTANYKAAPAKGSPNPSVTPVQLGTCSYGPDGLSTLLPSSPTLGGGPILTGPATVDTISGAAAPEVSELTFDPANPSQFSLKVRYRGPWPPTVQYSQYTVSFTGSGPSSGGDSASRTASRLPSSVTTTSSLTSWRGTPIPSPTKYDLPGLELTPAQRAGQIIEKTIGPFDLSQLNGSFCLKGLSAVATTSIVNPDPSATTFTPVEKRFSTVLDTPCPPPKIAIADARVLAPVTAGANPTLVVDYRNSGGAVAATAAAASKTFTLTLKNTVTPNKTATTAAISVPAPATTTTASPAVDFFTLAPACTVGVPKVSANLTITAATTAPTVAPAAFTKLVEYTCPAPRIDITNVRSIAAAAGNPATFVVDYQNIGGPASASGQTFALSVANGSVSKSATLAVPLPLSQTPPPSSATGSTPSGQLAPITPFNLSDFANGAKCGDSGVQAVTAPLTVTITTAGLAASTTPFQKTLVVSCPPKIEITKASVTAPETGSNPNYIVEYKNTGGAIVANTSAAWKTFDLKIQDASSSTGSSITKTALAVPTASGGTLTAPIAPATFQLSEIASVAKCGTPVVYAPTTVTAKLTFTPIVAAGMGAVPLTSANTVYCGIDLRFTSVAYKIAAKAGQQSTLTVKYKNFGASPQGTTRDMFSFSFKLGRATTNPVQWESGNAILLTIPANGIEGTVDAPATLISCDKDETVILNADRKSPFQGLRQQIISLPKTTCPGPPPRLLER